MAGLGLDYASSDEEDVPLPAATEAKTIQLPAPGPIVKEDRESAPVSSKIPAPLEEPSEPTANPPPTTTPPVEEAPRPQPSSLPSDTAAPVGPSLGPDAAEPPADDPSDAPQSPYTSTRITLRNLTMPPHPNFSIPDSPPGSPPPSTAKITKFLDLKKKGTHFNEKLASSAALRNPGLLGKLGEFAGLGVEDMHSGAEGEGLGVIVRWPEWAYADRLNKQQERTRLKRDRQMAEKGRQAPEFVSALGKEGLGLGFGEKDGRAGRDRSPKRKKSRFDQR